MDLPVAVDSEFTDPARRFRKSFLRNSKVWLGILIAANVAYVGVGSTSQRTDGPLPAPEPLQAMPSLRLVSEMPQPVAQAPEAPAAQSVAIPTVAETLDPMVCHTWGPFNNPAEFAETRARIEAAGGRSKVRQAVVFSDPDYLVYVGRRGKAENARRTLQELKSQSIDSALIRRGPYNNTLSVGVFSRPERASLQQQRVARLGYEVGIEEIERSYDVFHLEAQVPAGFEPGSGSNGPCADIAQAH